MDARLCSLAACLVYSSYPEVGNSKFPKFSAKFYPIMQHLTPPPSVFQIQIFGKYSITAMF
jgi:hypothetical protein